MDIARIQQIADSAVAAGASSAPVKRDTISGSVLLIDGDGLNYSCAGKEEASQAWARNRFKDRVSGLMQASGAESLSIQLTYPGSNKRMRYAIATRKPYQGQRKGHKPKNWEFLREYMQELPEAKSWGDREADDGIAYWTSLKPAEQVIIASEDKDMRMLSGLHLDMATYELTLVPKNAWDVVGKNGLQYGAKWFYLQLLHGDGVDHIPGLEKCINEKGNAVLCGEKTAQWILQFAFDIPSALATVASAYRDYYGEDWADRLVEQAALLWLSHREDASDWVPPEFEDHPLLEQATRRLHSRVLDARIELGLA